MLRAALAGNPNVGKSTVFNALTGLHQHTGNWAGKTVETKSGYMKGQTGTDALVELTDLPGTYSLTGHSPEEVLASDFLRTESLDCVVVVCDASALSRNLILTLQVLRMTSRCVVCVNLIDEAEKRGISVDTSALSAILGCPVLPCAARQKRGLDALRRSIYATCTEPPHVIDLSAYGDDIPTAAEAIAQCVVSYGESTTGGVISTRIQSTRSYATRHEYWLGLLDRLFVGKWTAYPVMACLVLVVFWMTLQGAGYLSNGLELFFGWLLLMGMRFGLWLGLPTMLCSFLVEGILATLTQVIAVMLPPMAIFFPLFTLLEDLGYLPRAAFCLDKAFTGCGACGKQALTMLMGLGCNAAGVTGCRIIDSPRERKLAILTNSFLPCNGRLPMVISLSGALVLLLTGKTASFGLQAVLLTLVLLLCCGMTLLVCRLLHHTLLAGEPSAITMELPTYRIPQWGSVLVRSFLDRTLLVLHRAIWVAAPAGALLWGLTHIFVGETTLYAHFSAWLDPLGALLGMDGVILLAFLFSLPAAELFLPLVLLGYGHTVTSITELLTYGWDGKTVVCVLWFTLFHSPCATTLLTIRKETGSWTWTAFAAALPTLIGLFGCMLFGLF